MGPDRTCRTYGTRWAYGTRWTGRARGTCGTRWAYGNSLDRPGPRDLRDPLGLRASVDRPGPRDLQDPLGLRASVDRPDPRDLRDPLGLRDLLDWPDPRDPLGQPARPDQRARRVTPARHRQFGSSPARIAFAAETTKSWLVLFARAARPTERSARLPAPQQPGYAYVGDLLLHSPRGGIPW